MPSRRPRFCIFQGGVSAISKVVHELNEEICDKEIRLIGATGVIEEFALGRWAAAGPVGAFQRAEDRR